jgi:mannitol/fructose-specific phosphotransferase system IIA component (Ntr-type)
MRLLDILQAKLVIPRMRSRTKEEAIEELVDRLVAEHEIRFLDRREVLESVLQRERTQSTGLDRQIALPHGRTHAVEDILGVLGIAPHGIPFDSTDGRDARLICLLVIPETQFREHIRTLADVARVLSDAGLREELIRSGAAGSAADILALLERTEGPGFFGAGA